MPLLEPPKQHRKPAITSLSLTVYSRYSGMLSIPAWEALGSPSHVAFGYDDSGYYVVPGDPDSHLSVKVHARRNISLGVIAAALPVASFPLRITLDVDDTMLRFAKIEQVVR